MEMETRRFVKSNNEERFDEESTADKLKMIGRVGIFTGKDPLWHG